MSIEERFEYAKARQLVELHGMVVVTEEHMQRLRDVVEAAQQLNASFSGYMDTRSDAAKLRNALAALGED